MSNHEPDFNGLFDDLKFRKLPAKKEGKKKRKRLTAAERIQQFFNGPPKPQSVVKTKIVASYFEKWAGVMIHKNEAEKIGYMDLFCGPGTYGQDNYESTPIQILKAAIGNRHLASRLVTTFNDQEPAFVRSLEASASQLPGLEKLKFAPQYLHEKVAESSVKKYEEMKLHPTLVFLDPCGYKGLSVRLMKAVLKDFGCDLIFFFNYNRVNMHSENDVMDENIEVLFGPQQARELKTILAGESISTPLKREEIILGVLKHALKEKKGKFFLPFRFKDGNKTSHHIILVSKNYRAYALMKEIMKEYSEMDDDGVPSFEYNSRPEAEPDSSRIGTQLYLFVPPPPPTLTKLQKLCNYLCRDFRQHYRGRELTVQEIFDRHNVDTCYIMENYKDAIRILEEKGFVKCEVPAEKRKKITIKKTVKGQVVSIRAVSVKNELKVTFL